MNTQNIISSNLAQVQRELINESIKNHSNLEMLKSEDVIRDVIKSYSDKFKNIGGKLTQISNYAVNPREIISLDKINKLFESIYIDMKSLYTELQYIDEIVMINEDRNKRVFGDLKTKVNDLWKRIDVAKKGFIDMYSSDESYFETFYSPNAEATFDNTTINKDESSLTLIELNSEVYTSSHYIKNVSSKTYPVHNPDGGVINTTNKLNTYEYNYSSDGTRDMLENGLWKTQVITAEIPELIVDITPENDVFLNSKNQIVNNGYTLKYNGVISVIDIEYVRPITFNKIDIDFWGEFKNDVLGIFYEDTSKMVISEVDIVTGKVHPLYKGINSLGNWDAQNNPNLTTTGMLNGDYYYVSTSGGGFSVGEYALFRDGQLRHATLKGSFYPVRIDNGVGVYEYDKPLKSFSVFDSTSINNLAMVNTSKIRVVIGQKHYEYVNSSSQQYSTLADKINNDLSERRYEVVKLESGLSNGLSKPKGSFVNSLYSDISSIIEETISLDETLIKVVELFSTSPKLVSTNINKSLSYEIGLWSIRPSKVDYAGKGSFISESYKLKDKALQSVSISSKYTTPKFTSVNWYLFNSNNNKIYPIADKVTGYRVEKINFVSVKSLFPNSTLNGSFISLDFPLTTKAYISQADVIDGMMINGSNVTLPIEIITNNGVTSLLDYNYIQLNSRLIYIDNITDTTKFNYSVRYYPEIYGNFTAYRFVKTSNYENASLVKSGKLNKDGRDLNNIIMADMATAEAVARILELKRGTSKYISIIPITITSYERNRYFLDEYNVCCSTNIYNLINTYDKSIYFNGVSGYIENLAYLDYLMNNLINCNTSDDFFNENDIDISTITDSDRNQLTSRYYPFVPLTSGRTHNV